MITKEEDPDLKRVNIIHIDLDLDHPKTGGTANGKKKKTGKSLKIIDDHHVSNSLIFIEPKM